MDAMASSNPKFKQSSEPAPLDRSWFLKDSAWDDPVWVLRPTNALEETKPIRVDWNFSLPSGLRFTDEPFASLLHASRQLIAYIRSHSLSTGLAQRAGTTAGYFLHLRELSSTPKACMPKALATAKAVPCPQNGSTTVRQVVCCATNWHAAIQASVPMARFQGLCPASGITSANAGWAVGTTAREKHNICE